MKIYNTLTKQIEEFIPNEEGKVSMYTCGPTVYHFAHIGNLRTYIFEDVLERTLNYLGYEVTRVMNITDVGHLSSDSDTGEDKMLKGAKREKKTVLEIADFYTEAFKKDCVKLNINWPNIVSKATDNIDYYIKIISKLLSNGKAYIAGGNVYFDTSTLEDYYKLTNHKEDELVVGVRDGVEHDNNKRNQADFVLWFTKSKFDDQELKWDSPWGYGYPGWHIECSGISMRYLGEYLDIHCGGVDNIFPHHTNEIAQSESFLGHKWCNYWVHGEHLNDQSGKMSKSNGEFLTISLLESKGYNPIWYRFMCLGSHYRKVLVFSYDALENAKQAYIKLKNKISNLKDNGEVDLEKLEVYSIEFKEALESDLNTSGAITTLHNVLKSDLNDASKIYLINEFDKVLGLNLLENDNNKLDSGLEQYINDKIIERNLAKQNRDYLLADAIRDELKEKGIIIKDTREGTTFEII
ncbi:MAG: cysteine--tRNA ligase [Firmicutes bacterium]|nr:cysteine--tRNA ligase [Bacillota bacterium]